jgi:hypothetical protein
MAVEWAMRALFDPSEPRHFSGIGRYHPGWSDRPAGVQWSLWHDLQESRVVLTVNLEGMADGDDWPIGRFLNNERSDPQLPALATQCSPDIEFWIGRDVWNPGGRGKIATHDFLDEPFLALSTAKWLRAVDEARASQNEDGTGRGSLEVLLKKGVRRVCEVSPHLHFALPLWGSTLPSLDERKRTLQAAREKLEPLHAFLLARVQG